MAGNELKIKINTGNFKPKFKVLHNLFIAARTVLELAEKGGDEWLIVDSENMDDLDTAYQNVVKEFGPSLKGFKI